MLLRSAGLAIKTLTTLKHSPSESAEGETSDFPTATNTYLNELHSVDIRLKRQIHGLVEAGIITKETPSILGKPEEQNQDVARNVADRGWDVGWLNTRSGKVERDMEAELWAKAKNFLEHLDNEKTVEPQATIDKDAQDEEMAD
jgi:hypothetical protein